MTCASGATVSTSESLHVPTAEALGALCGSTPRSSQPPLQPSASCDALPAPHPAQCSPQHQDGLDQRYKYERWSSSPRSAEQGGPGKPAPPPAQRSSSPRSWPKSPQPPPGSDG